MKCKYFLVILILFCTGCTVEYNVNIDEKNVDELITLSVENSRLDSTMYQEIISPNNRVYLYKDKYYTVNYKYENNYLNSSYNYTHDLEQYPNAKVINWCYPHRTLKIEDNVFTISTQNVFECANRESKNYVDKATINITTKLKVKSNNADEISGNTYIWKIDGTNYTNKPIQMEIKLPTTAEEVVEKIENSSFNFELIAVYGIVILGILLVIIYAVYKKKKNNNF